MKFINLLIVVSLVSVILAQSSRSNLLLAGVELARSISMGDRKLNLNGAALKEATFLNINVYVVGLYAEQNSKTASALMEASNHKLIRLHFLIDVDSKKLARSWIEDLRGACEVDCEPILVAAKTLSSQLPDLKKGQSVIYELYPEKVKVLVEKNLIGELSGASSVKAVAAAFIGNRAPEPMKQKLLGK